MGDTRAVRICGLYLPNGNPAPGPKYDYKLAWMARLARPGHRSSGQRGAGADGRRLQHHPAGRGCRQAPRRGATTRSPCPKAARRSGGSSISGFTEAFRARVQGPGHYTFWDYQAGAWNRNDGIRIDHFLLSPQAADLMTGCHIEKDVRGREKPSDHVPVWVEIDA